MFLWEVSGYRCGLVFESRIRVLALLLVGVAFAGCDKFWYLRVNTVMPAPVPADCIQSSLAGLEGAESVWVRHYSSDTARVQTTDFLVWSERRYGSLTAAQERGADSVRLQMSYSWVGSRPPTDSIQGRAGLDSQVLDRVTTTCWGKAVRITTEWPR